MAAIIDKHERINKIKTPKILLAGASNVSFGINSEKLENAFHVPVVNMGLHGGLGLSFILEELKLSIKKGDLVFLSIEYFLGKDGDYRLKKNTSSFYKDAGLYYSSSPFNDFSIYLEKANLNLKYLLSFRHDTNDKQKAEAGIKVYSREAFNKYGDVIAHLGKTSPKKVAFDEVVPYRFWEGIEEINQFEEYARKMNVKVFYLYPNFSFSEYNLNRKAIVQLQLDLKNNLKTEILNNPTDFLYPDSLFFDTVYHLDSLGREKRTDKMIFLVNNNRHARQWIYQMAGLQN
jgi:hypothetical protein